MTKAGLDYKNPMGVVAYSVFKNLCIVERNKSRDPGEQRKSTPPRRNLDLLKLRDLLVPNQSQFTKSQRKLR